MFLDPIKILTQVRDRCLIDEDDYTGVTQEPYIDEQLFDEICQCLNEPRPDLTLEPLSFEYVNWRGEHSVRTVTPISVRYGNSEFHTEYQWLLKAYCHDKNDIREFAMKDMM